MQMVLKSLLLTSALVVSPFALAQMDHSAHQMPAAKPTVKAAADAALGDGVVKSVNKAKGTALIAHGALPNGMPPMTMAYKVKNVAWLDQLKAGQAIRFATDADGTTVLRIEGLK